MVKFDKNEQNISKFHDDLGKFQFKYIKINPTYN